MEASGASSSQVETRQQVEAPAPAPSRAAEVKPVGDAAPAPAERPAAAERPAPAAQPADEKPAAEKPARKPRATRSKAAKKDEGDAAVSDAAAPKVDDAPQAAEEAPKPRRRGRKPKAVEEQVEQAPKPRRGRKPKAAKAEAASEQAPSAEVAQARALAQISQASVVRRQRRMEERAAEMLASAGSPDSDAAPTQLDAASLIDPALRPHRRGRKPKAYIEAERAAAAALAAAKLASQGDAPAHEAQGQPAQAQPAQAPLNEAPASESVSADAANASGESEKKSDNRPGRARRAASKAKLQADEAKDENPVDAAPVEASAAPEPSQGEDNAAKDEKQAALAEEQPQGRQSRRSHSTRARDRQQGEEGSEQRFDRPQRNDRNDRGDRNDRNGNDRADRNDKRNNKQNRKQRNNRFNGPVEPSVSREELAACKVAELREKAKELDIDYAGKKKAELVEEVYAAIARAEGFRDIEGILDITNEGFGYIRAHGYMPSRDDAFVPANMIRAAGLRCGDMIAGTLRPSRANDKFPGLAKIRSINGRDPEEMRRRPKFADLTPIYPNEPLKMEHGKESITGRAIDIVAPVGKGQRGLIVSPPKAGKTTILKKICQSIATNNPEVHLICLLVDERPEEVTDMQRSIRGDVVASTFDMPADNHTRVSELVIERAKRIVEMGGDVVVVLDSITRLARAYNLAAPASGRILSGGVDSAALYPPKRFLGAARNIENGGSLTILASALVDTGSKMDEVIFEEFKGTGNMELKLDRDLADRRIFPAIDPVQSGTRNEDLLIDKSIQPFVWGIRRILANMNNTERAAASFIKGLKGTNSNEEFLIRSAKKAADHPDAM